MTSSKHLITSFPTDKSCRWRVRIAQWVERWARGGRKVTGSNSGRSGGRIFFSRVNFLYSFFFGVRSTSFLPQWHVKDPGHSAEIAGDWVHLNTRTPLTSFLRLVFFNFIFLINILEYETPCLFLDGKLSSNASPLTTVLQKVDFFFNFSKDCGISQYLTSKTVDFENR